MHHHTPYERRILQAVGLAGEAGIGAACLSVSAGLSDDRPRLARTLSSLLNDGELAQDEGGTYRLGELSLDWFTLTQEVAQGLLVARHTQEPAGVAAAAMMPTVLASLVALSQAQLRMLETMNDVLHEIRDMLR
jgi:hypothetical protein